MSISNQRPLTDHRRYAFFSFTIISGLCCAVSKSTVPLFRPTVPSGKPDDISLLPLQTERGPLWIDPGYERGWRGEFQKQPETKLLNCELPALVPAEYAELDQRGMRTFYGQAGAHRDDQVSRGIVISQLGFVFSWENVYLKNAT